jgi:hypothetical protein
MMYDAAMGRPSKLTPEVQEKIVAALRGGNYRNAACHAVGIAEDTFRVWMIRGEEGQKPYAAFRAAVIDAETQAEITLVNHVAAAASRSWMAAAWLLAHRFPDRWADRHRIDIQLAMRQEAERVAAQTGLTVDEVMAEAERLLKVKP